MASTSLPRSLLFLLQAGVLLSLTATAPAAQTEFPHAAGTDSSGRAQAVSDAVGRVMIESPEFPRGLWVDLVDEGGQSLAGVQVEYQGRADSLVAIWSVDPSGHRQETLLWTRPGGSPLRLALRPGGEADLPEGLVSLGWRIDPQAENLLEPDGPPLTSWEELTAFLQERRQGGTGRAVVQIDNSTALAVDLADAEPVGRLIEYLEDRARMSLGRMDPSLVQLLLTPYAFKKDLALLEDSIVLTTSFVLVPGSELEKWILPELGRSRGPVTLSEAAALTSLSVNVHDVVDVSPLAVLTKLEWLWLGENKIVDVSPLAALTKLKWLWLGSNEIVDVSPLAALTSLEELGLGDNEIIDVSPLAALTNLDWLSLYGNEIVDVSPLAALTKLYWLSLPGNEIVDVSPLAALTSLQWLWLNDNEIADVSPLSVLTNLDWLWLANNKIQDISPLVANTGLSQGDEVYLGDNPLSDRAVNEHISALKARGVTVHH